MSRRLIDGRRPPLMLVGAVALGHALLLRPTPPPTFAPAVAQAAKPAPVLVRTVHAPPATAPAPALVEATAPPPVVVPPKAVRPVRALKPAPRPTTTPRAAQTVAAAQTAPPSPVADELPATPTLVAAAEAPARTASAAPPASAPSPSAPVQLPPSATLDYQVSGTARGIAFQAEAQLVWQRSASRYQAEWTVRMPLLGQRTQRSEGAVSDAGLAPERYAERARSERAAHFDPAGGRIRFSANTPDAAWQAGAQDRLSVSLQLGGLLAAAPRRYPPGSSITLHTAGVRDAEAWTWDVQADETLHIDGHALPTARLVRHPRKDYDTRVELWLARTLDYLPARLRITQANGDVADQQLKSLPEGR